MKTLIVIPYMANAAQGREIYYAISGWRRHYKDDYHIVVVGDSPRIEGDDITFIRCPRIKPVSGQYVPHLDFVNKFKAARERFPDTQGFVFCCDDYYAVNDFLFQDIAIPKMQQPTLNFDINSPNAWKRDKAKTRDKLIEGGYPTRNFTTHLPQYYEWEKLEALWVKYDMQHESYVMEDLYYNIYHPEEAYLLSKDDNYKFGIYEKNVREQAIREAMKTKIWITNSPVGWSRKLDRILSEHFNETISD